MSCVKELFVDDDCTVAFCHWKVRIHLFSVHPLKKNNRNKLSSIVLLSGCSKISGFALSSAHFKWQRATVCVNIHYLAKKETSYHSDVNFVEVLRTRTANSLHSLPIDVSLRVGALVVSIILAANLLFAVEVFTKRHQVPLLSSIYQVIIFQFKC